MLGWAIGAWMCSCVVASAQDGRNVLVVVELANPASGRIAAHYVRARGIPAENVVTLRTGATDEVTRSQYEEQIEGPIGAWIRRHTLQDRIFYIVLTKGIPLIISGSGGRGGTTSSVDSELTLLYQKLVGKRIPAVGPLPNPYFRKRTGRGPTPTVLAYRSGHLPGLAARRFQRGGRDCAHRSRLSRDRQW